MDVPGAISIVDGAISAINMFDANHCQAIDNEGLAFRQLWYESLDGENRKIIRRLDLTRQIAVSLWPRTCALHLLAIDRT